MNNNEQKLIDIAPWKMIKNSWPATITKNPVKVNKHRSPKNNWQKLTKNDQQKVIDKS